MTPTLLRTHLQTIGWTQRGLADRLGIHETRVRRWARGRHPVPPEVEEWLSRLAAAHERHPAPVAAWDLRRRAPTLVEQ